MFVGCVKYHHMSVDILSAGEQSQGEWEFFLLLDYQKKAETFLFSGSEIIYICGQQRKQPLDITVQKKKKGKKKTKNI